MITIQFRGLKSSGGINFFWSVNLNTFGQSFKQMSRILVTGGCGYIGSHTIVDLIRSGYEVLSLDSLVNSDENVLSGIEAITGKRIDNVRIDLKSPDAISS
jgi:NAD(P)-dependent dehydrogenase (short-subunit alcohol dehydrogenase family)